MLTLVCGVPDEPPLAMLICALKRQGEPFLLLDQAGLTDSVALRWQVGTKGVAGKLRVRDTTVDIREIRSVFHRFSALDGLPETCPLEARRARSTLLSLMGLLDVLPARVVNRRRAMMSNNSKPYQALLTRRAGFSVPPTLVTNEPSALLGFASESPLIYKSISSVRSIVAPLDERSGLKLGSLPLLPTQFQHRVDGFNVRVHVVGRRAFATRVRSAATDYRFASREGESTTMSPYELTAPLRQRCLALAGALQLPFAGIDLIVTAHDVYCLEVNPSPAYSYYEAATGQPIAEALARFLARPPASPRSVRPRPDTPAWC